jgi:carbonic anhydrase
MIKMMKMRKIFDAGERRNRGNGWNANWKVFAFTVLCILLLNALVLSSLASEVHWSYSGEEGPDNWGNLSPAFKDAIGDAQSPIDITAENEKNTVEFFYKDGDFSILNNGHTLQLIPQNMEENYIVVDGIRYRLQQLHFHTPSEHTLSGKHTPMEIHFVHGDDKGRLAVAGLFIDEGPENKAISLAWSFAPKDRGKTEKIEKPFPLTSLLPQNLSGIRYSGSLTTPPTTEGVSWILLSEHGTADGSQIQWFTDLIGKNARPVQPRNGRILTPFQGMAGQ